MRIEQTYEIARSPEDVFALLTDPQRLPEWQKGTVAVHRSSSGPLAVGERMQEIHAAFGRRLEQTVEVARYEPPRAFALRILDGPIRVGGDWRLEPAFPGTRLRFVGEGRAPALMKPLLAGQMRRHHRRLKRILEAG